MSRGPAGAPGVRAGSGNGQVRRDGQVRDADHAAAGIAVGGAIGRELLQVQRGTVEAGFLGEFAFGGLAQVLAVAQEPPGQGRAALIGLVGPLDDQDVQLVLADRQDGQVDGEVEPERARAGMAEAYLNVALDINSRRLLLS